MFSLISIGCLVRCICDMFVICCDRAGLFHWWVVCRYTNCRVSDGFRRSQRWGCKYLRIHRSHGCFRFLQSNFPDGICTMYDFGSMHLYVTTVEDHLLVLWSNTRTRCPTSRVCVGVCDVFIVLRLLGHFTDRFPTSFRLNSSSQGEGIAWSMRVDRWHSNTMSKSRLFEVAFLIAAFMASTQRSTWPFDWGYLRDDVRCSNPYSLANRLKRIEK